MHIDERREVWYFDPRVGGWAPQETPDAKYRLTCVARLSTQVDNEFAARQARGGWEALPREQEIALPGVERGLIFTCKPRQSDQGSFLQVTSKRFVDKDMTKSLLEGLTLYDLDLAPYPDPEQAVNVFCLTHADAEIFKERVRARTGLLEEESADLQAMYHSVNRLVGVYRELERLCQMSRAVVDKMVEDGLVNEAPSISERSKSAHLIREQATQLVQGIRDEELALENAVGQVEQLAWAKACRERAEDLLTAIERLYREHKSYEIQAVSRLKDPLSEKLPMIDSPPAQRRFLMTAVAEYYADKGTDCRLTEDGMVVRVGDTVIEFGANITVTRDGEHVVAEPLVGRQTAERVPRQL